MLGFSPVNAANPISPSAALARDLASFIAGFGAANPGGPGRLAADQPPSQFSGLLGESGSASRQVIGEMLAESVRASDESAKRREVKETQPLAAGQTVLAENTASSEAALASSLTTSVPSQAPESASTPRSAKYSDHAEVVADVAAPTGNRHDLVTARTLVESTLLRRALFDLLSTSGGGGKAAAAAIAPIGSISHAFSTGFSHPVEIEDSQPSEQNVGVVDPSPSDLAEEPSNALQQFQPGQRNENQKSAVPRDGVDGELQELSLAAAKLDTTDFKSDRAIEFRPLEQYPPAESDIESTGTIRDRRRSTVAQAQADSAARPIVPNSAETLRIEQISTDATVGKVPDPRPEAEGNRAAPTSPTSDANFAGTTGAQAERRDALSDSSRALPKPSSSAKASIVPELTHAAARFDIASVAGDARTAPAPLRFSTEISTGISTGFPVPGSIQSDGVVATEDLIGLIEESRSSKPAPANSTTRVIAPDALPTETTSAPSPVATEPEATQPAAAKLAGFERSVRNWDNVRAPGEPHLNHEDAGQDFRFPQAALRFSASHPRTLEETARAAAPERPAPTRKAAVRMPESRTPSAAPPPESAAAGSRQAVPEVLGSTPTAARSPQLSRSIRVQPGRFDRPATTAGKPATGESAPTAAAEELGTLKEVRNPSIDSGPPSTAGIPHEQAAGTAPLHSERATLTTGTSAPIAHPQSTPGAEASPPVTAPPAAALQPAANASHTPALEQPPNTARRAAERIVEIAEMRQQAAGQELNIVFRDGALGRVGVRLAERAGIVQTLIRSDNHQGAKIIGSSLPALLESLSERGMQLSSHSNAYTGDEPNYRAFDHHAGRGRQYRPPSRDGRRTSRTGQTFRLALR